MREYNFLLDKALQGGLRPRGVGRNAQFFDEMKNLIPWGNVVRTPEQIQFPIEGLTLSGEWPWPQLVQSESVTLLRDKTAIYEVDPVGWTATEPERRYSYDAAVSEPAIAGLYKQSLLSAFGECWFLNNGGGEMWFKLPYLHDDYILRYGIGDKASPNVSAIAKYDDRLFIAGLDGGKSMYSFWFNGTRFNRVKEAWRKTAPESLFVSEDTNPFAEGNWILWSEPNGGSDDMPFYVFLTLIGAFGYSAFDKVEELLIDSIEKKKIGMMQLPVSGAIHRMMLFGNDLLVFCERGIFSMSMDRQTGYYASKKLNTLNLCSRAAVDGIGDELVFLDGVGTLWRYYLEDRFFRAERYDYGDHFENLALADVRVVRDPIRGHYYIGDGATAYVFTGNSLGGPLEIMPTTMIDVAGVKMGYTHKSGTGQSVRLVSSPVDLMDRGKKRITLYQLGSDGLTSLYGAVDYDYANTGQFFRSPLKPFNPEGVVFQRVSFSDGRVVIQGVVENEEIGAQIDRIEVRYQAEDRRYVRGTKGMPGQEQAQ